MGYGLAAHAAEHPGKAAIIVDGRTLRYGELGERTNRLANVLRGAGIGAGDRVAAMLPDGWEYYEVLHAAGRLRAALVPVNTHFRAEEVGYMLEDSGAKAVVVGAEYLPEVRETIGERPFWVVGSRGDARDYEAALARSSAESPP